MVTYYQLGKDKRLEEIVVAGGHDAGIASGGSNVQTQSLDMGDQPKAGVRVFDLRIAAATASGQKAGAPKQAELRAFHAQGLELTCGVNRSLNDLSAAELAALGGDA